MNYQELIDNKIFSKSGKYYARHINKLLQKKPDLDEYYDLLLFLPLDNNNSKLMSAIEESEIRVFCPSNYFEHISNGLRYKYRDFKTAINIKYIIQLFENVIITHDIILLLIMNGYTHLVLDLYNTGRINNLSLNKLQEIFIDVDRGNSDIFFDGLYFIEKIIAGEIEIIDNHFTLFLDIIPIHLIDKLYAKYYDGSVHRVDIGSLKINAIKDKINLLQKYMQIPCIDLCGFLSHQYLSPEILSYIKSNCEIYYDKDNLPEPVLSVHFDGSYNSYILDVIQEYNIKTVVEIELYTDIAIDTAIKLCSEFNYEFSKLDMFGIYENYDYLVILLSACEKYRYHIDIEFSPNIFRSATDEQIDHLFSIYNLSKVHINYGNIHDLLTDRQFKIVDRLINAGLFNRSEILFKLAYSQIEYRRDYIDYFIESSTKINIKAEYLQCFNIDEFDFITYLIIKSIEYPEIILFKYTCELVDRVLYNSKQLESFYDFVTTNSLEFKTKIAIDNLLLGINNICNRDINNKIDELKILVNNLTFMTNLVRDKKIKCKITKEYLHEFFSYLPRINAAGIDTS